MAIVESTDGGVHKAAHAGWHRRRFEWTSGSGGSISDTYHFGGCLHGLVSIPGAGVSDAFALELLDAVDDFDFLNAAGSAPSSSDAEWLEPLISSVTPVPVVGDAVLRVSGAGNAKSGTLVMFLKS